MKQFSYRGNVLILATSQAFMLSAIVMSMALGALLGGALAPDKGFATIPIAVMVIGTAIASLPAAILMRKHGRRVGFSARRTARHRWESALRARVT